MDPEHNPCFRGDAFVKRNSEESTNSAMGWIPPPSPLVGNRVKKTFYTRSLNIVDYIFEPTETNQ